MHSAFRDEQIGSANKMDEAVDAARNTDNGFDSYSELKANIQIYVQSARLEHFRYTD